MLCAFVSGHWSSQRSDRHASDDAKRREEPYRARRVAGQPRVRPSSSVVVRGSSPTTAVSETAVFRSVPERRTDDVIDWNGALREATTTGDPGQVRIVLLSSDQITTPN